MGNTDLCHGCGRGNLFCSCDESGPSAAPAVSESTAPAEKPELATEAQRKDGEAFLSMASGDGVTAARLFTERDALELIDAYGDPLRQEKKAEEDAYYRPLFDALCGEGYWDSNSEVRAKNRAAFVDNGVEVVRIMERENNTLASTLDRVTRERDEARALVVKAHNRGGPNVCLCDVCENARGGSPL